MRDMQAGEAKQAAHICILLIVIMPCPWGGGFVCFYFLTLPSVPSLPMFKYSEILNNFHMHLNAPRSECTCSSEPHSTDFKMKVMKMLITSHCQGIYESSFPLVSKRNSLVKPDKTNIHPAGQGPETFGL